MKRVTTDQIKQTRMITFLIELNKQIDLENGGTSPSQPPYFLFMFYQGGGRPNKILLIGVQIWITNELKEEKEWKKRKKMCTKKYH